MASQPKTNSQVAVRNSGTPQGVRAARKKANLSVEPSPSINFSDRGVARVQHPVSVVNTETFLLNKTKPEGLLKINEDPKSTKRQKKIKASHLSSLDPRKI